MSFETFLYCDLLSDMILEFTRKYLVIHAAADFCKNNHIRWQFPDYVYSDSYVLWHSLSFMEWNGYLRIYYGNLPTEIKYN